MAWASDGHRRRVTYDAHGPVRRGGSLWQREGDGKGGPVCATTCRYGGPRPPAAVECLGGVFRGPRPLPFGPVPQERTTSGALWWTAAAT